MTERRADEICTVACNLLCKYMQTLEETDEPGEMCYACPLAEELAKEVERDA